MLEIGHYTKSGEHLAIKAELCVAVLNKVEYSAIRHDIFLVLLLLLSILYTPQGTQFIALFFKNVKAANIIRQGPNPYTVCCK